MYKVFFLSKIYNSRISTLIHFSFLYLLYKKDRYGNRDGMPIALGVMQIFSLVFCIIMYKNLNARRKEMMAV